MRPVGRKPAMPPRRFGNRVGAPLLLIDLETAEGVTGRAYLFCYQPAVPAAVARILDASFEVITGNRVAPLDIGAALARHFRLIGVRGIVAMALAGIDVACWDALAIAAGMPLAAFLGGAPRPIRAYNSNGLGLISAEAAADEAELKHMVATAAAIDDGPSAFRYPRGEGTGIALPKRGTPLEIGKGRVLREGSAVALFSFGARLADCLEAADQLAGFGLPATVADARFAKPLDKDLLRNLARNHEVLVTIEEGSTGGFGALVLHALAREGLLDRGLKIRTLTLPDKFIEQNKPKAMYVEAGLDAAGIVAAVFTALGKERDAAGVIRLA